MSGEYTFRRVVISHGALPGGERSLDIAVRLATIAHADLKGLFVEETSLLDLADLPFSRTVAPGRRDSRNLDREELQKTFTGQAKTFRRALSLHADRLRISWEFAHTQGDILSALTAECRTGDIAVLGGFSSGLTAMDLVGIARKLSAHVAGVLIAAGTPARRQGPVVAIDEGGAVGAFITGFAGEMASNAGLPLLVISRDEHGGHTPSAGIANAVRKAQPWCVVADLSGPLFGDDQSARALMMGAQAPVLLLRR